MNHGTEEQSLVRRLNRGDNEAFELLFYRYRGKVYNFVKASLPRQTDAEGIVHEVFLRIWTGRENIDPNLPFAPYLFRTARNLVIDRLRSHAYDTVGLSDELLSPKTDSDATARVVEEEQLREWFHSTLERLPGHRRKIFLLNRFEGHSYKAIASMLNISENTVDTQIRRALTFFRKEFDKLRIFIFF